jgi:manganese transport protein
VAVPRPAFVAAVAYVDPGNFATGGAAGSKYGYLLVWVVVSANLMAMLVQTRSAKLGVASGLNLAEACRETMPRARFPLWIQAELVAMATDIAEIVGAALGLHLLTGLALFPAALVAGAAAFAILELQRRGFRRLEFVIAALVGVIAVSFALNVFFTGPDGGEILRHQIPDFADTESILLATGILGATGRSRSSSAAPSRSRPRSSSSASGSTRRARSSSARSCSRSGSRSRSCR